MTPQEYKTERKLRGSQQAVADALGVHRMTITKRETGVHLISQETVTALLSLPKLTNKKGK
jgi:transcriptional regulator with XRE-family HTH domain